MIFEFKEYLVRKNYIVLLAVLVLLSACGRAANPTAAPSPTVEERVAATVKVKPSETAKPTTTPTETPIPPTETPTAVPTLAFPAEGRGPTGFESGVNPLTGLAVSNPALLERRPIVIKVENIPREHRPQWGLTLADLVYEYYTEMGSTRFSAIYYGQDSQVVGPIRSGRFFDSNVIEMYKGIFVFGSAYVDVRNRFFNSDFASRLILETTDSCPSVCRYDPGGKNFLVADTAALQDYVKTRNVDNTRQNLDGMFFQQAPPAGGQDALQLFVRYSGAIYNRWDYDAASGRYLRFAETQNDINRNNEVYAQLTDRQTSLPVTADTVVMLCVPHRDYVRTAEMEVLEILMDPKYPSYVGCDGKTYQGGSGAAFAARNGKIYPVSWQRSSLDSVLTLVNPDGSLFAFKPGQTWFEVLGSNSRIENQENAWRFTHVMR
jgi:hypothetical protein